jgi:hypothetical protein
VGDVIDCTSYFEQEAEEVGGGLGMGTVWLSSLRALNALGFWATVSSHTSAAAHNLKAPPAPPLLTHPRSRSTRARAWRCPWRRGC